MSHDRRSVLAALGLALPLGLTGRRGTAAPPTTAPPVVRLRAFEELVREAFARAPLPGESAHCRRVEVGVCDLLHTGIQGCHNDRPFAGFAPATLRIVRTGSELGPVVGGTRLCVSTVDVVTGRLLSDLPARPLDFTLLPPAPVLVADAPPVAPVPPARETERGAPRAS